MSTLKEALKFLANNCDYANSRDGAGFNAFDAQLGHLLAEKEKLTNEEQIRAYNMLRKYKGQLSIAGIYFDEIPAPERKKLSVENLLDLNWSEPRYIRKLGKYVRSTTIPSEFWDLWKKEKTKIKEMGISPSKWQGEWQLNYWSNESTLSTKKEKVVEKKIENKEEELIQENIFTDSILYEYQQTHATKLYFALKKKNIALDSSSTGTGKTFSALVIAKKLIEEDKISQVLVICPKAVIPAWDRSAKFLDMRNHVLIANYELAKTGKVIEYHQSKSRRFNVFTKQKEFYVVMKKIDKKIVSKLNEGYQFNLDSSRTLIIWDEAHRCKNVRTQNSQLMIDATEQGFMQLLLTATLAESPLKMWGTGKALGLYTTPADFYYNFCASHGCVKEIVNRRRNQKAWVFRGDEREMSRIHEKISHLMDGMNVDELREKGLFPKTLIIAEPVNFNGANNKIEKIYSEMFKKARELREKKEHYEMQKDEGSQLKILQKAMQEIELLKIPILVEMIQDEIESGNSIVVFFNYVDSIEEMNKILKQKKVIARDMMFYGKQKPEENERVRELFQDNIERVIICNSASAKEGIDLHDEHHTHPRIALISPNYSAQILKQIMGRVDRTGGTDSIQRIIYADCETERKICEAVQSKIANIDALNDHDTNPFF